MSDYVNLSINYSEDANFCLRVGHASICFNELLIKPASNSATPHYVQGHGEAKIYLTNRQMLDFLAEWCRYSIETNNTKINTFGYQITMKLKEENETV